MTRRKKDLAKLLQSLDHWTSERAKAKSENDAEAYTIANANRENTISELIKWYSTKRKK